MVGETKGLHPLLKPEKIVSFGVQNQAHLRQMFDVLRTVLYSKLKIK